MNWLYYRGGRSVLLAIVFHLAANFGNELFQTDPAWHDLIPFHEYFHGDTGAGIGASHQTGWTGLVADLIIRRARGS